MTMADVIAVMNRGRIEQLGTPTELYEHPRTAFVAGFLGVSNLLQGTVDAPDCVRLDAGDLVRVPPAVLAGRTGRVGVGIRPEKIRLGRPLEGENGLLGSVQETAYVGVSTQYVVRTGAGPVTVYVQNAEPGRATLAPGDVAALAWNPEATFVVDAEEEQVR